jgi:hypothetical protein
MNLSDRLRRLGGRPMSDGAAPAPDFEPAIRQSDAGHPASVSEPSRNGKPETCADDLLPNPFLMVGTDHLPR